MDPHDCDPVAVGQFVDALLGRRNGTQARSYHPGQPLSGLVAAAGIERGQRPPSSGAFGSEDEEPSVAIGEARQRPLDMLRTEIATFRLPPSILVRGRVQRVLEDLERDVVERHVKQRTHRNSG